MTLLTNVLGTAPGAAPPAAPALRTNEAPPKAFPDTNPGFVEKPAPVAMTPLDLTPAMQVGPVGPALVPADLPAAVAIAPIIERAAQREAAPVAQPAAPTSPPKGVILARHLEMALGAEQAAAELVKRLDTVVRRLGLVPPPVPNRTQPDPHDPNGGVLPNTYAAHDRLRQEMEDLHALMDTIERL